MKGESDYLDMKEMLVKLDSNSVQVQGALDILDSYFEQIALTQFEREADKLYHWLLVELILMILLWLIWVSGWNHTS